jgi:hypothetical protein
MRIIAAASCVCCCEAWAPTMADAIDAGSMNAILDDRSRRSLAPKA